MPKQLHGAWLPDRENYLADEIAKSVQFGGGPSIQFKKFQRAFVEIRKFRHAIDIGANLGLWTRTLARCFATVTCFEPNQECHEAFWLNNGRLCGGGTDRPTMSGNVTLYPVALGAEPGRVKLNTQLRSTGFVRVDPDGDFEVEQRTLDSFDLRNVDLIKIDVEGWEHPVIRGAVETIRKWHPLVILEQKPGNAERHGFKQFGALNLLKKMGGSVVAEIAGDFVVRFPK